MTGPISQRIAQLSYRITDERDRWILWTPVFLGGGIGLYFALPSEPPALIGAVALAGAIAGVVWRRNRSFAVLATVLLLCSLGFGVAQFRTMIVAEPVLAKRIGPVALTGRAVAFEKMELGSRVTLERLQVSRLRPDRIPKLVRVRLRGAQPPIVPGDWLSMRAVLSPPPAPATPGAFDFQRQSYFRGLGAVGFAYGKVKVVAPHVDQGLGAIWPTINRFRTQLQLRVTNHLGGERGAVAAALMMGERRAISEETMTNIRNSGLAHLLAISGLHIGLVAFTVFFSLRTLLALSQPLALGYPIKKWAAVVALGCAFFYALVAGGTLPTQRAFLMIAAIFTGVLLDREGVTMRLVAFAATLILLARPESLLSASFQMSFAAVIGLVAVYEAQGRQAMHSGTINGAAPKRGTARRPLFGPLRYLMGVAAASVIATLATAPFVAHHFNQIAVYGVLANLVAVPVTALWVMPWAVVSFLLYPFGLDGYALTAMGWGVQIVLDVAAGIAPLPGAVARFAAIPLLALVLAALGGLWLCLWRGRWRYWGGAGVAMAALAIWVSAPPDLMVDEFGRLFAVRSSSGEMAVSTRRAAKFTRGVWLRRAGLAQASLDWPRPGAGSAHFAALTDHGAARSIALPSDKDALNFRCDSLGCLYRPHRVGLAIDRQTVQLEQSPVVAFVTDPLALAEDCASATVLIATVSVPGWCRTPKVVIDRWDLWRNGAHAVWLGPDGTITVQSVAQERGQRPWVVRKGNNATND